MACKTLLILLWLTTLAWAQPAAPPANRAERRAAVAQEQVLDRTVAKQIELRQRRIALRRQQLEVRRARMQVKRARAYEKRIEIHGSDDFMAFRLRYLSHKMRRRSGEFVAPAPAHFDLTSDLTLLGRRACDIDHLTGAYSRGFGKSVIGTEDFALWLACGCPDSAGVPTVFRPENVVIVGASSEEREYRTRLRNITAELDTNSDMTAKFPGLLPAKDKKGGWVSYTDSQVILTNGTRLACMPFGGNIRGQSYLGIRPTFVLIDDPETRKLVRSADQLAEARRWFEEDVIGAEGGEGMAVVWLGTFLSYDCLLRWLQLPEADEGGGKGWTGPRGVAHFVPLLDSEGHSNWPSYFTDERVERIRKKHGTRAFAIERLLMVRPEEDAVFHRKWFFGDGRQYSKSGGLKVEGGVVTLYGQRLEVFQRVDPASGKYKDKGDFFALATVGINPRTEDMYLLALRYGRYPLKGQTDACIEEYDRWNPRLQEIEAVAMQVWLNQQVLDRRALRVREVKGVLKDKHERIEAFSVHPENAKFHVDPDEPAHAAFIDQAEAYPLTKHDDLLDAVSGACECALAHYQRQGDRSTRGSGDNPPRQRPRAPKVAL